MTGRNHRPPPSAVILRELPIGDPRNLPRVVSVPAGRSVQAEALEDRIEAQHREIQSLLLDNQRLAATHVALKQDLAVAKQDLHRLSTVAAKVKAETDAQVRGVYERSSKLEVEVRQIDVMAVELDQVRADVQKLCSERKELAAKLLAIEDDLPRARADAKQVPAIKAEIEAVRQELHKGRSAIEYEKQNRISNLEISDSMKENMVFMAHEIEKLHSELANAEKRARAAAAVAVAANPNPGPGLNYGTPEMEIGGSPYLDPYSMHQGVDGSRHAAGIMDRGQYIQR